MAKKRIEACRSGKDFLKFAQRAGADIRNGKGSHCVVRTERGSTVVPVHNQDLGKGLRSKLIKTFVVIGLAVVPLVCLLLSV